MKIEDIKKEARCKYYETKIRMQNDTKKVVNWFEEHPEMLVPVGATIFAGAKYVGKNGIKYINLHKAQNVKELFVYDPSMGHYWELSRKLSNAEWLHIDQARANGERMANILNDMGVLKGKRFGL